jgi:hypothetical protein
MNGRRVAHYQDQMRYEHGLFGDLYALRGDFLRRMKAAAIRLPDDLIGDDSLLGALAKTNLGNEDDRVQARVLPCEGAGFLCDPFDLFSPSSWRLQYRRMINYSVRHFQNQIIIGIMRGPGPQALPRKLASLYASYLVSARPRSGLINGWFDRLALRRMSEAS